jgi:hypothetical protein
LSGKSGKHESNRGANLSIECHLGSRTVERRFEGAACRAASFQPWRESNDAEAPDSFIGTMNRMQITGYVIESAPKQHALEHAFPRREILPHEKPVFCPRTNGDNVIA